VAEVKPAPEIAERAEAARRGARSASEALGSSAVRLNQIEAWALEALEAARRGTLEDDRVELKSTWPDARRTARRLAGQGNAARGEPVIWLVGVADDGLIVGAPPEEVSNWWAQVIACFADDVYPTMQHVAIHEEGATVVALVFETDRAPYVITVGEDARAELEVPWRAPPVPSA
jgi:hypothetical protein